MVACVAEECEHLGESVRRPAIEHERGDLHHQARAQAREGGAQALEHREFVAVDVEFHQIEAIEADGLRKIVAGHGAGAGELHRAAEVLGIDGGGVRSDGPTGEDGWRWRNLGAVNKEEVARVNARREIWVQRGVDAELGECKISGLESDYPSSGTDKTGEMERVRADVGTDIPNDIACAEERPVGAEEPWFVGAQEVDGQVDAFVEIEVPLDAGAAAAHSRGSAG